MPVWYKYFLIWFFCKGFFISIATAQFALYESLTIENGLSQGMIFDILQTKDGFLWVATKSGLNRYDGYNFKVFSHDPFDSRSIADDNVDRLFEDSRGWLWASTVNKRLDVYDTHTGRFHHVPLHFDPSPKASPYPICNMIEDKEGRIWVLYPGGDMFRISMPEVWSKGLPDKLDLAQQLIVTKIQIETLDKNQEEMENFWFEADGSISLFSSTKQYRIEKGALSAQPVENPQWPKFIFSVAKGPNEALGETWIMGDENQLYCFTHKEKRRIQIPEAWESDRVKFRMDAQGKFWMLHGPGIWQLSPSRDIDFSKPDWTFDRDITQIGTDRNENIWVGTYGYGLRKINLKKRSFHTAATGNSIWRLWRSPNGRYYCRRGLNRLFHVDIHTGLLSKEQAFPDLGEKGRKDMLFEASGHFWLLVTVPGVITLKGFLHYYDPAEKCLKEYPFDYLGYDYARLFADRDGFIWITGAHCQLIRFDPRTEKFDYFNYGAVFGEKAQTVQAIAITQDGNGTLWVGTQLGLVKCQNKSGNLDFQVLQTDGQNPKGLNNNSIACLLPDPVHPEKILWIGTKGGGINCLDLQNAQVGHLTMANGLPDKVIYGILPGNENPKSGAFSLWCSTNRGLIKLNIPNAKQGVEGTTPLSRLKDIGITTFTAAKGLQDNEFNTQSFYKADNGEMLFGGVNGLNYFFPEQVRSDTTPPPVFIVGIEINHKSVWYGQEGSPLKTPVDKLTELNLSYDQNNISFEFSALDFSAPTQNRYRYRLIGLDADWVETGSTRFAHFTHLAPGRYEFKVQGSNGEGKWQEIRQPVVIVISPPWYRTYFAWLIYVLLLAWAGWQVYRFQIQRVKDREQLAFEQREKERVKAMERVKVNFFSNVTHEFRTPLSMIIEPLRQFMKDPKLPSGLEKLRLAERNSQKLLGLVNQLLDLAKIESGSMGLDLRQNDLSQVIRETFQSFLPLAENRGITMKLFLQNQPPHFPFDVEKVELILNNLISNALKFTPQEGRIHVKLEKDNEAYALVKVGDTGIGIPPEAQDKIFDRFYQVDGLHHAAGEGTGIGLALSRELAELMGGTLTVESQPNKGSTFTLHIPLHPPSTSNLAWEHEDSLGEKDRVPVSSPNKSPEAAHKWPNPEKPVVLIVEDNVELRKFIKSSLDTDWQITEASNGEEGLKMADEILPDLILSDVMMPDKDGYELCHAIKSNELTAHIPIILLTSKSTLDAKLKGLRIGADDYLTKPFHTDELLVRMENLLESRRRLRQHFMQQLHTQRLASDPTSETTFLSPPDREFLKKFILMLEQNLSDDALGVEELAKKMLISRIQLHRKLKAITDQNVTDFVKDYRLERAMAMLKNREGMVYEVASKVGFVNEKYFSRVFKEKYGISPGQVM